MILGKEELALLKRGRPWFILQRDPGWAQGQVVKLRHSRRDEGWHITVQAVVEEPQGFRVLFTPGDSRAETRYIASNWPDYTSDPFRAMRDELPPFEEHPDEKKARKQWLMLAIGSQKWEQPPPQKRVRKITHCQHCGVELKRPRIVGAPPRPQVRYCSDRCTLLARYEGRRLNARD